MAVRAEAAKEIVVTRTIDAPRARVFEAWADPKQLARWWGPRGWTNPVCEVDLRPGGAMKIVMRGRTSPSESREGDYPMTAVIQEVLAPERIVFVSRVFEDEKGRGTPGLEIHHTITFAEHSGGGKTVLTIRARVLSATPQVAGAIAGMEEGWTQSLNKLADHMAKP
jgi:uncharacterized protein YndB with AHSA1/START domain